MAERENLSVGKLVVRALTVPDENVANATQITSRATGVTANGYMGAITTDTTSLAAAAEATFVVTNNKVKATSVVVVSLQTPSATGLSFPAVTKTTAGTFEITLTNVHGATADTSASVINYFVFNGNP